MMTNAARRGCESVGFVRGSQCTFASNADERDGEHERMAEPIDNPILSSPYEQPDRHYEIGPDGPTGVIRDGRRPSESFIPIAITQKGRRGKDQTEQLEIDFDATGERRERNTLINDLRRDVAKWRMGGQYVGVTPVSRKLLQHWADPGQVRSNDTSWIALWMIDTDYNEESFFVRHCYFTGGNDPYKRLKTALKADIDPDAWDSLYRTVSRPFATPATGMIAVKVINDYGDEVMKVFEVG
jgi:hypothetical protein